MSDKQNGPASSAGPSSERLTNAESFPLLFNQRYHTGGRSGSTVTAHSLLSSSIPKSEAELRKHKIGQNAFITLLILSASFLILFPPMYNHFMNPGKVKKAIEASQRSRYLEGLKCECERKKHYELTAKEVSLKIVTYNRKNKIEDTYQIPLTLGGTTCSPYLKSNVSECAEWGKNNIASGQCGYSRVLGTVNSIIADVKHHEQE